MIRTISIQELHEKTNEWIREASRDEILVTDGGKPIARIVRADEQDLPYFARRKVSPEFEELSRKLTGGTDCTIAISEDREDRYS